MRRALVAIGLAVGLSACARPAPVPPVVSSLPPTTAPVPAPAPTPSDVPIAPEPIVFGSCDEPDPSYAIVCEAYELVQEEYVDIVSAADLAAGAFAAVDQLEVGEVVEQPICPLPGPSFEPVCATAASKTTAPVEAAEAMVRGMVAALDPNSAYLDGEALQLQREEQRGTVEGIGALVVVEDPDDRQRECGVIGDGCVLVIVSALDGGPAERAGVQPGDVIAAVDGTAIEGSSIDQVTAAIRGPAGTGVLLTVARNGQNHDLNMIRAAVTVPVLETEILEPTIGLLRLAFFSENAPRMVEVALDELIDQGATTILVDLQNNPGGSLVAAVEIASQFLADGDVVRTEAPDDTETYGVRRGGVAVDPGIRIVVLLNRGSASASEVVAAVLQERGRATVMGEASYGKNTVQQQYGLSNGGALKLTVARWLTPGGHDFGGTGVTPDVAVNIPDDAEEGYLVEKSLALINS